MNLKEIQTMRKAIHAMLANTKVMQVEIDAMQTNNEAMQVEIDHLQVESNDLLEPEYSVEDFDTDFDSDLSS